MVLQTGLKIYRATEKFLDNGVLPNGRRAWGWDRSSDELRMLLRQHGYDVDSHFPKAIDVKHLYAVEMYGKTRLGTIHSNPNVAEFTDKARMMLPFNNGRELDEFYKDRMGGFVELGADVQNCLIDRHSAVLEGSKLTHSVLMLTVADGVEIYKSTYMEGRILYAPPFFGDHGQPQRVSRILLGDGQPTAANRS